MQITSLTKSPRIGGVGAADVATRAVHTGCARRIVRTGDPAPVMHAARAGVAAVRSVRTARIEHSIVLPTSALRLALCAALLALACTLLFPAPALAREYHMPHVYIEATVDASGNLHVSEQRTFDFDGSFSCVWWDFDDFKSPKTLRPQSVQVRFLDRTIPEFETFDAVPFQTPWREAGGPPGQACSFDEENDAIYVFFNANSEQMVVKLDYIVENAVVAYEDCAELYWQYVGPDWAEDSENVVCNISLPANGATGVPGDTVRAWGHGPLDGSVDFDDTGTQVRLSVPLVRSESFAEARVVFPREWLTQVNKQAMVDSPGLAGILEEEQREADAANMQRMLVRVGLGAMGLVGLAGIVWSAVMFARHGRELKPTFTDKYWRDVPNKDVHPAVIGRLLRWNRESKDDVVVTIMHLANLGAITINKGSHDKRTFFGSKTVEDYYIARNDSVADHLANPIDVKLMKFLFGDVADNAPSLWLDSIAAWGEAHPKSFSNKMKSWQGTVSAETVKQNYFEVQGSRLQVTIFFIAGTVFVIGMMLAGFLSNLIPAGVCLIVSVVMAVFGVVMPRRSQKGVDDRARARALRNWLNDFTLLDERLPTDVKVWGQFMVYAQLFGIAKQVIRELRDKVPQVFATENETAGGYVPWYVWYESGNRAGAGSMSFASAFDDVWSNTTSSVRSALSESSSGGGGGGGFSGGGGGGFGGGGGGAR